MRLTDRPVSLQARFRVADRQAELWCPDTGEVRPAAHSHDGDRTIVPLSLERHETLFVVFRGDAVAPSRDEAPQRLSDLATISGDWEVTFPAGQGAPDHVVMPALESWTAHESAGVRYFSGTATYRKSHDAPSSWFQPGRRLILSLGDVRDVAEVFVNDQPLGIIWKPPYRVDATSALHVGINEIEVRVTNQWTNRILGDRAAPPEDRVLSGVEAGFRRGPRELEISGLLGPVRILVAE